MRESALALRDAFVKGVNDSGADGVDIGLMHFRGVFFCFCHLKTAWSNEHRFS